MSIYLDTHVIVWLYAGLNGKFTQRGHELINQHTLLISPIVQLELQYLFEIKRATDDAKTMISALQRQIKLRLCNEPFASVVHQSLSINWTRDSFDRLIVAHAQLTNAKLLTIDKKIQANYPQAVW